MNAETLTQYNANKRRLAKVYQGKAMPRLRHLSQEFVGRAGPVFKPMAKPAPPLDFGDVMVHILGAIPFLSRRERRWRK